MFWHVCTPLSEPLVDRIATMRVWHVATYIYIPSCDTCLFWYRCRDCGSLGLNEAHQHFDIATWDLIAPSSPHLVLYICWVATWSANAVRCFTSVIRTDLLGEYAIYILCMLYMNGKNDMRWRELLVYCLNCALELISRQEIFFLWFVGVLFSMLYLIA